MAEPCRRKEDSAGRAEELPFELHNVIPAPQSEAESRDRSDDEERLRDPGSAMTAVRDDT